MTPERAAQLRRICANASADPWAGLAEALDTIDLLRGVVERLQAELRGYMVTSLDLQRAIAARSTPFSAVASFPGSSSIFVPDDRVASVERTLKAGSVPFTKHAAHGGTSFVVRDGDVAKVQEAGKRRAMTKLRRETW